MYRLALALGALCLSFILAACQDGDGPRESRLSAAVTIVNKGEAIQSFLRTPGIAYVQAYVRFGLDLADDVIMAVDQEFLEGVDDPIWVSGGDWMAFVGVQRSGTVWVAAGTEKTLAGSPSSDRDWKILNLGSRLQPDTWYRFRLEADFGKRHFRSFLVEGPGISKSFDLSQYPLDYPNYAPFSGRAMTYYVVGMRGRGLMKDRGTPLVYFDDVEAAVKAPDGRWVKTFVDSFEGQNAVGAQPLTYPVVDLAGYQPQMWYLERDEALVRIEQVPFARTGSKVAVADANID